MLFSKINYEVPLTSHFLWKYVDIATMNKLLNLNLNENNILENKIRDLLVCQSSCALKPKYKANSVIIVGAGSKRNPSRDIQTYIVVNR